MPRILIVDDNPDVRKTLQAYLNHVGHETQTAANEYEAFVAVTQETFDFVCIDIRLYDAGDEDKSGLSLAMTLHAVSPQIRTIVLTGYIQTNQIVRAVRYHGAVGFIDKVDVDWCQQVVDTIAEVRSEETGRPVQARRERETRLALSLTTGQPISIRSYGQYVYSSRSWRMLRIPLERYARHTELARGDVTTQRFQIQEIGKRLWRDVFEDHPEVGATYREARAKGQPCLLHFEGPRQYLRLPLEFLYSEDPPDYVVLRHPVARLVYNAAPTQEAISPVILSVTPELHVLIVASNTDPPIDAVDDETQELCDYLDAQDYIPVETVLIRSEEATYARMQKELERKHYDIIHYAGHGDYDPSSPENSCLYFWETENRQGEVVEMTANQLKMSLEDSPTRLVYLSCCNSSTTGCENALLDDDFLGLADAVVQAGVPSVLGFRWPVSDKGAKEFALAFYESLLKQGSPEIAAWQARRKLARAKRSDPTWLSPILIHQQ